MGNASIIGEFEQMVLLAVLRIGERAHAALIRSEIAEATGREVSRGAVYTTLDRLENKGLLGSWMGEPRPVRSGRARRYYTVEPEGIEALNEARAALDRLWAGLEPALGDLPAEPGV